MYRLADHGNEGNPVFGPYGVRAREALQEVLSADDAERVTSKAALSNIPKPLNPGRSYLNMRFPRTTVSQSTYESDWLAFMLASNARLLGGGGEEEEFEFPMLPQQLPAALTQVTAPAPEEAVPEPGTALSIVAGGVLLVLWRRQS
ncbi:MAG: PEP-CTERM sorting domain-containing protein [Acidobacteria bacterium]|nr:PEP-CTERM sorting domain-containing protein [Acidobacteriota bacterium]